ncbi:MAG: CDP-alcohol phosphatidyltransferase family protein [Longimicrobiaceae bacterium]
MANFLTIARVLLIFVIVAVWARQENIDWWWLDALMVPLLAWAIFMDALDGWVARRRHEESEAGALFDIAGDRIVELVLWVFFAIRKDSSGTALVPMWVPVVMITRTVLTDFVRSVAYQVGKTPFGEKTMMRHGWTQQLVSSRWSRALYGVMKAVAFCALGVLFVWDRVGIGVAHLSLWRVVTAVIVFATVGFSVARALPVLWDGRRYVGLDLAPRGELPDPAKEETASSAR